MGSKNRISVQDIRKKFEVKKDRVKAAYEKLLDNIFKRIKNHVSRGKERCLFPVPQFIFGYPRYDYHDCLKYLIRNVKEEGFVVKFYKPNMIYISWEAYEVSNKDRQQAEVMSQEINQSMSMGMPEQDMTFNMTTPGFVPQQDPGTDIEQALGLSVRTSGIRKKDNGKMSIDI